jgi:cytochrome c-type biogenesis protein CcmF
VAIAGFTAAALVALWQLVEAHLGAYLGWPRPEQLKPLFETLSRWTGPGELAELRVAFAKWDVDRYGMNAWLVPLATVLALAGGHYFLPGRDRRVRWSISAAAAGLALLVAWRFEPSRWLFTGAGITSSSTTAIFPRLDALAVAATYLAGAGLAWAATALRQSVRAGRFWGYTLPVAAIHLGVMLALIGGTAATVFDSYAQKMVRYPDEFGQPITLPDGYEVTVWLEGDGTLADGARGGGVRSVAKVGWRLVDDGRVLEAADGHAVYRDERPPASGEKGPVRLMCEILDYRYARYVSGDAEMIHPFIHRGLWRDVQLWLPAIDYSAAQEGGVAADARRATTPWCSRSIRWPSGCGSVWGSRSAERRSVWPPRSISGDDPDPAAGEPRPAPASGWAGMARPLPWSAARYADATTCCSASSAIGRPWKKAGCAAPIHSNAVGSRSIVS